MKAVKFALLFLIFILCKMKWDKPIKLNSGEFNSIQPMHIYHDISSQIGYLKILSFDNGNKMSFVSRKIFPDSNIISPFTIIDKEFDIFTDEFGNMNILHVSFENGRDHISVWSRTRNYGLCTEDHTDGCEEVYYSETKDNGQTWGKPVPVPRKEMNDWVERRIPSVIYIKETGRVFIFYNAFHRSTLKSSIAFVTRPLGSSIFTNEVSFDVTAKSFEMHTPVYTISNNIATLHVFWTEEFSYSLTTFMYTKGVNGLNWEKPRKLYEIKDAICRKFWALSDHSIDSKAIHLILSKHMDRGEKMIIIISSYDEGETWNEPLEFTNTVDVLTAAICGTSDSPVILMNGFVDFPNEVHSFWMYFVNKEVFVEFDQPFEGIEGVATTSISCGNYNEQLYIRALGYNENTNEGFITCQKISMPE